MMKRKSEDIVGMLLLIPVACALMPLARGFVLASLWGWFVVPLGLPALGVLHAVGLCLAFGMLAKPQILTEEEQSQPLSVIWGGVVSHTVIVPPVMYLAGWALSGVM